MTTRTGWEARLASRPAGLPAAENFTVSRVPVPDLEPGQVLVRNQFMALASVTATLMAGGMPPLPGYPIGAVLTGRTLGRVLSSADPAVSPGSTVLHNLGWRDYAVAPARDFQVVDPDVLPDPVAYLSSGFTAYIGLVVAAGLRAGETVYVSSAAGAVGSFAGQIARVAGAARVVGSAGTAAKAVMLTTDLGYDAAFDHRDGPLVDRLRTAAPDGIDVYFDNVGGRHLDAAVGVMRPHGRVALCGALAQQSGADPAVDPATLVSAIGKRLTLRGFTTFDHLDRYPPFLRDFGSWLRDGRVKFPYTVVNGVTAAPQALRDQLTGRYAGTVVVAFDPDD
jgi:NADPH-dependent curcumin reductase CurA